MSAKAIVLKAALALAAFKFTEGDLPLEVQQEPVKAHAVSSAANDAAVGQPVSSQPPAP